MKPIYKYSLLLAATLFILSACDGMSGTDADPTEETVTLRLKSAVTGSDAKTSVNEDGTVLWSAGDIVYINGEPYEVEPLESDPSLALVEGVRKSVEYFASYPEPLYETGDGYYEVAIPEFQHYMKDEYSDQSYSILANPMIAYSTSEEIDFFNIGAVLCLGITGNSVVTGVSVTNNDGSHMAGSLLVSKEEVIGGFYSDRYMWTSDARTKRVLLDGRKELSPSDESLFYIVVAPEAYEEGITVYVRDESDNVAIQSSYDAQNLFRNMLVTKEPFEFIPMPAPDITPGIATASRIGYEVYAQPGAYIRTALVLKSDYEAASESGYESFVYEILVDDMSDAVLVGSEGRCEFFSTQAYGMSMVPVDLSPDTGYVIVAAYSDSEDIFQSTINAAETRTAASSVDPEPSQGGVTTEDFTFGEELKWQ